MDKLDIPCIKYIVSHIDSVDTLPSFYSFFQRVILSDSLLPEHIPSEYLSKVPAVNSSGVDMYYYGGRTVDASDIFSAPDLPAMSGTCSAYCKKILGEDYGGVCKVCSRFTQYANDMSDKEYALLRYASMSEENLFRLKTSVGSSRCIFRASVDLASDLDYPRPVVVSLTSALYGQIVKSKSFYNNPSIKERIGSDVIRTHIFAKLGSANKDVAALLNMNRMLSEVMMTPLVEGVANSKEINEDEMGACIDVIVAKHGRKRGHSSTADTPSEDILQPDLFNLIGTYPSEPAEPVGDAAPEESNELSDTEAVVEAAPSEETPYANAEIPAEPEYSMEQDETAQDISDSSEYEQPVEDLTELPLYTPVVKPVFINSLPDLTSAYMGQSVTSLSYEIVICEERYYMVSYIPVAGIFCKTDMSELSDWVLDILASSCRKITWQPYLTYSLVKTYGRMANNVDSILYMFIRSNPTYRYGGYEDVMRRCGVDTAEGAYNTGSLLCDKYLGYLPYYDGISKRYRSYVTSGLSKVEMNIMEYMGVSYRWGSNFKTDGYLFGMDINCRIYFNEAVPNSPYHSGYIMSYAINCPTLSSSEKERVIELILISLSNKKYFRKFNLQLMVRNRTSFTLFCEDYAYDAVKTFIRMNLDRYALEHKVTDFTHVSDHRHVSPTLLETNMPDPSYPTNMRRAQGMLLTVHDSIRVADDRVRVDRTHGEFKKQGDTFPDKVRK